MNKRSIPGGIKDENGIYTPLPKISVSLVPPEEDEAAMDISIDALKQRGLVTIDRIMKAALVEASTGSPSRESVQNLKDCLTMLQALEKDEKDTLSKLSDDSLKAIAGK